MADINFLGTIALGKIKTWDDQKSSGITPVSFPGKDSGATAGVDTLGIIAYINIRGRYTGSPSEIQDFIQSLKLIIDGAQFSVFVLRSPFVNSNRYDGETTTYNRGNIAFNTSVTANKLIDNNANFDSWNVTTSDKVKNLISGEVAGISSIDSGTQLTLDDDIFTATNTPYALTSSMNCKVLSFNTRWELPGLTYCDYELSVMQVR